MKRVFAVLLFVMVLLLSGCCFEHQWEEATCAAPNTCTKCGKTDGEPLPHAWKGATCTAPKTCFVCGAIEGELLPHTWVEATCAAPQTCSVCGSTEGTVTDSHVWEDATCEKPRICSVCCITDGDALEHESGDWKVAATDMVKATVKSKKTCSTCGKVLDEKSAPLEQLHDGDRFLMTPAEFTERLNNMLEEFSELDPHSLRAKTGSSGENFVCGVIEEENFDDPVGAFLFGDKDEESMVEYSNRNKDNFSIILGTLSGSDDENVGRVMLTFIRACDPTLDMTNAIEIARELLSSTSYKKNGLTYVCVPGKTYAFGVSVVG